MTDGTLTLIKRTVTGKDSRAKPIYSETSSEVLCILEDVSRSEYFSAGQIGIEPEALAVINPIEYSGEKIAVLDGRRMNIYRTFKRSSNEMELYLNLAVGLGGAT